MSQETWEILCGMKTDDVELQLALQCAPLITGLGKIGRASCRERV